MPQSLFNWAVGRKVERPSSLMFESGFSSKIDYRCWGNNDAQKFDSRHMDPLSITVGIIGILGAAVSAAETLHKISEARNAPSEVIALGNEVRKLYTLILDTAI